MYSWVICAVMSALFLPPFVMLSFIVVASEKSDRYFEAAAATVVALPLLVSAYFLPGLGGLHLVEQWAAGRDVDRTSALDATYTWARGALSRGLAGTSSGGLCCLSLSVRLRARLSGGWSSTGFWAPFSQLPPS